MIGNPGREAAESSADTEEVRQVASAFDRVAPSFDGVPGTNPIYAWMHEVNSAALRSTFPSGSCLLDLGCGTGTDAIALAKIGCNVLCLDVSEAMVTRAREKVRSEGLEDRVVVVKARARDLQVALRESPWHSFDGGYANFSLTFEPDLRGVARSLATVLRAGAFFIGTLPNRIVLSEVLLYGSLLRFRDVLWRFEKPLLLNVHGSEMEIEASSPWKVRDAFGPFFRLRELVGLPAFLPPVYLSVHYQRLGAVQAPLKWLDRHLANRYPWNRLGEHTLFKFERR